MRAVWLAGILACSATLAHAEDMAAVVSKYRIEHGLSAVKTDPQLTAVAQRQAKAMADAGVMSHSVGGSFYSRIKGATTGGAAAENIAAGQKSWQETFRAWQTSSGHNANLLLSKADSVGFAVVRNDKTRYKTYWAMVIADKSPKKNKGRREAEARVPPGSIPIELPGDPVGSVKDFVCKFFC